MLNRFPDVRHPGGKHRAGGRRRRSRPFHATTVVSKSGGHSPLRVAPPHCASPRATTASAPLLVSPECPGPTVQMTRPLHGLPASSPATPILGCHWSEHARPALATKPLGVPAAWHALIFLFRCLFKHRYRSRGNTNSLENNIEDAN